MTWVAAAVVALGLIAVVIYLFVFRWRRMARHGRLEVPCDEVVALPAGDVVVYYEDSVRRRYSERPEVPAGLSILVSEAEGGERVDLANPPTDTATKRGGRTRIPHASLRPPRAGRYRVVASLGGAAGGAAITLG
ncbi:MAG: hypothetical protein ACRDKH_05080 [Solirubrobacterales bacterium]